MYRHGDRDQMARLLRKTGDVPARSLWQRIKDVALMDVAVIARHPEVSGQVWSALQGYPGDPAYREFHRKDERSGLRYWRVTDVGTGLGGKAEYSPHDAAMRVR